MQTLLRTHTSSLALALLAALPLAAQHEAGAEPSDKTVALRYASFDPLASLPALPTGMHSAASSRLFIVQCAGLPTEALREAMRAAGAELHGYLPHDSYLVRMDAKVADTVRKIPNVRWVGRYEPAYRLAPEALDALAAGEAMPARRYHLVVVDKHNDKPALAARLRAIGANIDHEQPGSILFDATLSGEQLRQAADFDEVRWIDAWTEAENDVDNARVQGGANYVETIGGFTGQGVRGHIYEGIDAAHYDFTNAPINVFSGGGADDHGHATSGIVFGNGTSNPAARGLAPDAQPFYTNYSSVTSGISRWQVVEELVQNRDVMFTTASWGGTRTFFYTSVSADSDDIVFDHDIAWTQSQSNAGNQDSRPEAWAKNVISIGGVRHGNNADRIDDTWSGGGSTGPAADGRIKPELSAYYDNVMTSDRLGAAGYSAGDFYASFSGTSSATPIVAGHNALAIQMFTDGLFGPQRVPGGSRFDNRPHSSTLKALMVANARQYVFAEWSSDNLREHTGYGFPDLRTMYDNRARMLVVDETDVLSQGQIASYTVAVQAGDPELKVVMSYVDPAANPAAAITRINDLNLRVTAPDGTVYHGNRGLADSNYSIAGGSPNSLDTLECVFVQRPMSGNWTVEVEALLVAQDGHVETPQVDADFGLCVSFGVASGSITPIGVGCVGSATGPAWCAAVNGNGGVSSNSQTSREYAYELSAASPLSVSDVEVFTASRTGGTTTVNVSLYGATLGGTPLATTTMAVTTVSGFHRATFAAPIAIPAGRFFVSVAHANVTYIANLTGGQAGNAFFLRQGAWTQSGTIRTPSVRANCPGVVGSRIAPTIYVDGDAQSNAVMEARIADAPANAPMAMVFGLQNQTIGGLPLPISLDLLGAIGCSLYATLDATVALSADSSGRASGIRATISNDPVWVGVALRQQALVLDPAANALGVTTTRAIETVIGSL